MDDGPTEDVEATMCFSNNSSKDWKKACDICGKHFKKSYEVLRHKKSVHRFVIPQEELESDFKRREEKDKRKVYKCKRCQKSYSRLHRLRVHKQSVHILASGVKSPQELPSSNPSDIKNDTTEKNYECNICSKKFVNIYSARRHEKEKHNVEPQLVKGLKCSECNNTYSASKYFEGHFVKLHPEVQLKFETFGFETMEDFEEWKLYMEKETCAFYSFKKRYKILSGRMVTIYHCHRSGEYSRTPGEHSKNSKKIGTNKIGFYCPSKIRIEAGDPSDPIVNVEFQSVHIGHKCEANRLRLSKIEKEEIVQQLQNGVPVQHVLNSIAEVAIPSTRLAETKAREVRIIAKKFKIGVNNRKETQHYADCVEEELVIDSGQYSDSDYQDSSIVDNPNPGYSSLKEEAQCAILDLLAQLDTYEDAQFQVIIQMMAKLKQRLHAFMCSDSLQEFSHQPINF